MTVTLAALCAAAATLVATALLAVYVTRRERHRARTDALEALAQTYGVEPMLRIGNDLGWIERHVQNDYGVKVKVRR